MSNIPGFWETFKASRQYAKLPPERKRIVFYSEGKTYWPFLRPFIRSILDRSDEKPTYISSEKDDPGLSFAPDRMTGICIGAGFMRSYLFSLLDAKVVAMTMPDLDIYHVKRSHLPVHYVYLMHGCDSVFMVLREQALDRFDSVFCAGPHNIEEIRKRETMENLPAKHLVEVGYPYQDELIADAAKREVDDVSNGNRPLRVLVAPSWSQEGKGTLETVGHELIGVLLDAGFETTLRPHPQTRKFQPQAVEKINKDFGRRDNFRLEADTTGKDSLMQADILISDWSAITFEFAFSRLKPVLYIDVPRKTMNPNYEKIGLVPFEVRMRNEIGSVLSPSEIGLAPERIRSLCADAPGHADKIRKILHDNVFNVGTSADVGADALISLADQVS